MSTAKPTLRGRPSRPDERGVILFIALIVLVAMTLAGIAMFRTIGAGVIIAGNMAFKQNATSVGDLGIEAARAWLINQGSSALQADQAAAGYYASWALTFNPSTFSWDGANSGSAGSVSGNDVRYVIHRLCSSAGSANDPGQSCVTVGSASSGGSLGTPSYGVMALSNTTAPYFRITVRVAGPRNTTSYVQSIMY